MFAKITSTTNSRIKQIKALQNKKFRDETGEFVLEGEKLFGEVLGSGLVIKTLLAEANFLHENPLIKRVVENDVQIFECDRAVIESVSSTRTAQGVVVVCALPQTTLPQDYAQGLWLVLDSLQDPGNVGAMLRSADAFGAVGVLLGTGCADPYGPKAIRAAMGSTFHLPVVIAQDLPQELVRMKEQGFALLAAHLKGKEYLPQTLPKKIALLIGNEGNGLSQEVTAQATLMYRLEMKGRAESLNAAVCAGILLYEVSRRMNG